MRGQTDNKPLLPGSFMALENLIKLTELNGINTQGAAFLWSVRRAGTLGSDFLDFLDEIFFGDPVLCEYWTDKDAAQDGQEN
jgi:hypothetical protein